MIGDKSIVWKQWKGAFHWDLWIQFFSSTAWAAYTQPHSTGSCFKNEKSLGRRCTWQKNAYLDAVNLWQSYRDHIMSSMEDQELNDGTPLNCALQLFQHTAEIVDLFNSKCPLTSINDIRLRKLNRFYSFMLDWREKSTDDNSSFISSKLWFDLQSMCLVFHVLVQVKLHKFPHSCIKLAIVNQDWL